MEVPQSWLTLCDSMHHSPLGSSVHGILQARILKQVPFSRGSSWPRDWTWVSYIAGRFFTIWATRKVLCYTQFLVIYLFWNFQWLIYLLLTALSLCHCVGASSGCGERGLLSSSSAEFSHCSASHAAAHGLLSTQVSVVVAPRLWRAGSVVVAQGLSCSKACGIFPDQGSNPCPLHCQADSCPLYHQGSSEFPVLWWLHKGCLGPQCIHICGILDNFLRINS